MTGMRSLFVLAMLGSQGVLAAEKEPQLETPGLRQRAEDLARAASQRFTDIIDDAKQNLTQGATQPQHAEKPSGEDRPLAPVWDWLERSAQSYDQAIVAQLKSKDSWTSVDHQEGKPPTPAAREALPELRGWNGLLELVRYWLVRANSAYRNEIVAPLRMPGASKAPVEVQQTAVASASSVAAPTPAIPVSPEKRRTPDRGQLEREATVADIQRRADDEKRLADAAEMKRKAQAEARARLIEEAEIQRRFDEKRRKAAAAEAMRQAEEAKREADEADAAERRAVAEAEAEAKRKAEIEAEATRRIEAAARAKASARAANGGSSTAQAPTAAAAVPSVPAAEPPSPSLPQDMGGASRAPGVAGEKSVVAVAPPAEGKNADAGQRAALAGEVLNGVAVAKAAPKANASPNRKSKATSAARGRHKAHARGKWRRPHVRKHHAGDGGAGFKVRRCSCPCRHDHGRKAKRRYVIAPAAWEPVRWVRRYRVAPIKYHKRRATHGHRLHYMD